jgi:hypothetical protein
MTEQGTAAETAGRKTYKHKEEMVMATKTKKTAPAKKTTAAKKKTMKKGSKYACSACGLVVSVDEVCGCVDACEIICCGKPMKTKK